MIYFIDKISEKKIVVNQPSSKDKYGNKWTLQMKFTYSLPVYNKNISMSLTF